MKQKKSHGVGSRLVFDKKENVHSNFKVPTNKTVKLIYVLSTTNPNSKYFYLWDKEPLNDEMQLRMRQMAENNGGFATITLQPNKNKIKVNISDFFEEEESI